VFTDETDPMTFQYLGLHHVQLAIPRGAEDTARRFFGELLGWPEIDKPEPLRQRGGMWFRCGAHEIHIGLEEPHVPAKKAHPAVAIDDIDALQRHLEQRGVAVRPEATVLGMRRIAIDDPFGNKIEFIQA
jgi:catechol 2,3-dioxygenase-like lactoylglutathione lyase family enzyme